MSDGDKTFTASVPISQRLLDAASPEEIAAVFEAELTRALNQRLAEYYRDVEHLALYGNPSAPQPRGLLNMRGH